MLPIFIPCFFGDSSIREKRVAAFEKQLRWFLSLDKRIHLHIDIMDPNYTPFVHNRIAYNYRGMILHSSITKNLFLHHFYSKTPPFDNSEWCILADNDSILYDHFIGGKIFSHMLDYPKQWSNIDMWYPINPINEPFTWRYKKRGVKEFIFFEKGSVTLKGSLIALKNTGKEVYFNEKRRCSEDTEFLINMMIEGKKCYKCTSTVLKELVSSKTASTFHFLKNPEERKQIVANDKIELAEKYPPLRATKKDNGNVSFETKAFYERYRKGRDKFKIPIDPTKYKPTFTPLF